MTVKVESYVSLKSDIEIGDIVLYNNDRFLVLNKILPLTNGEYRYGCANRHDSRIFFRNQIEKTGIHLEGIDTILKGIEA